MLFDSSKAHKTLRKMLVEEQKLDAIVPMPQGVFKPYAGVSTAILLFTKTNSGGTDDVWFYDMQADGYSLDDKRTPQPENSDLADILARWRNREAEHSRKRTDQSFSVPKAEIAENDYDLSISRYKEIEYTAAEYDPPTVILERLARMEEEIAKGTAGVGGDTGVKVVSLQQVCDVQIGKTPARSVPEYWGGELPWVSISDLAAGRFVNSTKEGITPVGAAKSRSRLVPRGTLLLSFKLSLGKRAVAGCDLFTNEAIAALRVLDQSATDRDYLYWALGTINYDRLVDRAAKGKTLNKAKLKVLKIPHPPIAEQKRIAGILDAADALRAMRCEALAQLDTLLQSTFLDMFGDPVINPRGWPESPLDSVASLDRQSVPPSTVDPATPYVGLEHVDATGAIDCIETVSTAGVKSTKFRFSSGHVLFGKLRPYLRKIAKPSFSGICSTDIVPILPTEQTSRDYLFHLLRMPNTVRLATMRCTGANLPRLRPSQLAAFPIPLPPLDLQHRFATIAESIERQKTRQRAHLAELDTLFASLQSRAFRGDL